MTCYAVSDIHGMYDIYEQICNYIGPDDRVYFLGDAADRGPDGFKCIKAIYENPQWIYMKGNHEDLMVKGLKELQDEDNNDYYNFDLWMMNGGQSTYDAWCLDGCDYSWIEKLENLPLHLEYSNEEYLFHLTHAGFTCGKEEQLEEDKLLWNRRHFFDKWDEENHGDEICIHGHTPIFYLIEQLDRAYYRIDGHKHDYLSKAPLAMCYCDGHKICIDNGVFFTKSMVMYDLDNMRGISFYCRER